MIIAIAFSIPIIIFIISFVVPLYKKGGKAKTISIILFLVLMGIIGLLYFTSIFPLQRIIYDRKMNSDKIFQIVDNKDFGKFLSSFKPVKLPLRFKAAKFKYKYFNDIPVLYLNKFFYFYKDFSFSGPNIFIKKIKDPGYYNFPDSSFYKLDVKNPKYLFMPIINDKFIACIFMFKVYNDEFKQKSQYMYLVTFNKKGTPLSCLKVGEATYHGNNRIFSILPVPYTKSLCTIRKDFTVKYRERCGYYYDPGEYVEGGWETPYYYKISDGGLIKTVKKKKKRIRRDE
jgi:hypothetical protein